MRCIFCKKDSRGSSSVEHIIPESLGNELHTLPPGVVCDACNNYFSREVEKPFLDSESIRSLRFEQALPNKRGRIPTATGILLPYLTPAIMTREVTGRSFGSQAVPEASAAMLKSHDATFVIPVVGSSPSGRVVSRFLSKIAIEVMASRLLTARSELDGFIDEVQLDPMRDHARRGTTHEWPFSVRGIYDRNKRWTDGAKRAFQVLHEYDVLATEWGEWFLVVAIFGLEFAINYGGPEIEGYERWLRENNNVSPLYGGSKGGPHLR